MGWRKSKYYDRMLQRKISADYEIEHFGTKGNVTVDMKTNDIIERTLSESKKGIARCTGMIRRSLLEIAIIPRYGTKPAL